MTVTAAPALRTALHLLLALCLLLQGTMAVAMASTMAVADGGMTGAPGEVPQAGERADALPPCHAAEAATETSTAGDHGCCEDAGGLCEWACTAAPSLLAAPALMAVSIAPPLPPSPVAATDPRWPTSTPLRPPIA